MKILHLTLYKEYFDQIKSDLKKVERRDNIPYWRKRLYHDFPGQPKYFDQIHFRNGYGKTKPLVKTEHCNTFYNSTLDKIELIIGDILL
ncbi:unnamed protein product [marine sediment metagenome]|uniref:ASCH domain-containing protein n=1 Tax=marine sediment metagenome TaxID=412755 RepID=X1L1X4_9ZZZZ